MNILRGARTAIITVTATTALVAGMIPAPAMASPTTKPDRTHAERVKPTPPKRGTLITPEHDHQHATPKVGRKGVRVPTATLNEHAFGDPTPTAAALTASAAATSSSAVPSVNGHVEPTCYGTGSDGNRVQVVYAREAAVPSRYTDVLPVIAHEVRNVDDVVAASAAKTGGGLRVRWVTDGACQPTVLNVTLPNGTIGTDWNTFRTAMINAGYNAKDRKYLVFADANAICGLGDIISDDRPSANYNDGNWNGAMFGRVDTGCWNATADQSAAAHELFHTLGAVQPTAPNTTGGGHCSDELDQMCYDDGTGVPMRVICPGESLLDCGDNDYFAANPATGSWLATHWNTARSTFLGAAAPLAPVPTDGAISGPATVITGMPFTMTATATGASSYEWLNGSTNVYGASTASVTETLYGTGSYTYRVKVGTSDGRALTLGKTVYVTKAPAPAGTLTSPATIASGQTFKPSVAMSAGMGTYSYNWVDTSVCVVVSGHGTASPTYSCTLPTGTSGAHTSINVAVSQPDGQSVTLSRALSITAPRASSAATLTVTENGTAVFTGTLTRNGAPYVGAMMRVERQSVGDTSSTWAPQATIPTNNLGKIEFTALATGQYRIVFAGDATTAPSTSGTVVAIVKASSDIGLAQSGGSLTATLSTDGIPVPGATLTVQQQPYGTSTWTTVGTVTTDTNGSATYTAPTTAAATYRFAYAGTSTATAVTSNVSTLVKAAAALTTTVAGTAPAVLTGTLTSADGRAVASATVTVQRRPLGSSTWSNYATVKTSSTGAASYSAPMTAAASYRFTYAGGASTLSATGTEVAVRVPVTVTFTQSGTWPRKVTATVKNKATGKVMTGVAVAVQARATTTSTYGAPLSIKTNSAGQAAYSLSPKVPTIVRFTYAGSTTYLSVASTTTVTVPTVLSSTVTKGRPNVLKTRLTTKAGTALAGKTVSLQRRYYGSSTWTTIATTKTSSTGYITSKQQPKRKTYYRWVFKGETGKYNAVTSASVYVTY